MQELKYKIGQQVKYLGKWFEVVNIRVDVLHERVHYYLKDDFITGWVEEESIQGTKDERSVNEKLKDIKGNWQYEKCIKPEDVDWLISTVDEFENERIAHL